MPAHTAGRIEYLPMPARMKDIARDLGVSVVTVSKAIRNHSDISKETRERVLQRAKELNYQPNPAARSLVTGRTYTVGLIVPDLVFAFFGEVAKAASGVLRQMDYGLLISSSDEDPALEKDEIERLLARRADALIVASTQSTADSFRLIEEQKVPYVLFDRRFAGLPANFIGVDDEQMGDMATQHLVDIGRRRIAHIRGRDISTALGRMAGYRRALARNGLSVPPSYIVASESSDNSVNLRGYDSMLRLLKSKPRPDGVFCYNDVMATGALQAILEQGLRVPEDIALIGCGNNPHSSVVRVPLSTIDQDTEGIGEKAAKLALKLIESKSAPERPKTVLLSPKLIIRDSTRCRT